MRYSSSEIGVDDREIDAAQVEQRVQVLGRPARDDGQDMQVRAVIDHARHLRGQPERRAFDQAGRQADGPGVDLVLLRRRSSAARAAGSCRATAGCSWPRRHRGLLAGLRQRLAGHQRQGNCCRKRQRAQEACAGHGDHCFSSLSDSVLSSP